MFALRFWSLVQAAVLDDDAPGMRSVRPQVIGRKLTLAAS